MVDQFIENGLKSQELCISSLKGIYYYLIPSQALPNELKVFFQSIFPSWDEMISYLKDMIVENKKDRLKDFLKLEYEFFQVINEFVEREEEVMKELNLEPKFKGKPNLEIEYDLITGIIRWLGTNLVQWYDLFQTLHSEIHEWVYSQGFTLYKNLTLPETLSGTSYSYRSYLFNIEQLFDLLLDLKEKLLQVIRQSLEESHEKQWLHHDNIRRYLIEVRSKLDSNLNLNELFKMNSFQVYMKLNEEFHRVKDLVNHKVEFEELNLQDEMNKIRCLRFKQILGMKDFEPYFSLSKLPFVVETGREDFFLRLSFNFDMEEYYQEEILSNPKLRRMSITSLKHLFQTLFLKVRKEISGLDETNRKELTDELTRIEKLKVYSEMMESLMNLFVNLEEKESGRRLTVSVPCTPLSTTHLGTLVTPTDFRMPESLPNTPKSSRKLDFEEEVQIIRQPSPKPSPPVFRGKRPRIIYNNLIIDKKQDFFEEMSTKLNAVMDSSHTEEETEIDVRIKKLIDSKRYKHRKDANNRIEFVRDGVKASSNNILYEDLLKLEKEINSILEIKAEGLQEKTIIGTEQYPLKVLQWDKNSSSFKAWVYYWNYISIVTSKINSDTFFYYMN